MYAEFLISLANQLDIEGKFDKADLIDEDFETFLELLEEGKLNFENLYSWSPRDPRSPYCNPGIGPVTPADIRGT